MEDYIKELNRFQLNDLVNGFRFDVSDALIALYYIKENEEDICFTMDNNENNIELMKNFLLTFKINYLIRLKNLLEYYPEFNIVINTKHKSIPMNRVYINIITKEIIISLESNLYSMIYDILDVICEYKNLEIEKKYIKNKSLYEIKYDDKILETNTSFKFNEKIGEYLKNKNKLTRIRKRGKK